MAKIPKEYLICPECHSELDFDSSRCKSCSFTFQETGEIASFLPAELAPNKLHEDTKWENHELIEAKDKPGWFSLVAKEDDVFYLYDKILPNYSFKGCVLEIAAGACWISGMIKLQNPDTEVIASDVSSNALSRGKEIDKIVSGGKIDYFVICDAEKLPFKNECFDVVIGGSMVHHFLDPYQGTSEIYRILKKDGYYLSILELEANRILGYIWNRIGTAGVVAKRWDIKENVYTFKQYRNFFKSAGFKEVKFSLERDPKYKHNHWFLAPYYKLMSYFPDWVVKLLGSSVSFVAYK